MKKNKEPVELLVKLPPEFLKKYGYKKHDTVRFNIPMALDSPIESLRIHIGDPMKNKRGYSPLYVYITIREPKPNLSVKAVGNLDY